jgi:hypothetical protein
MDNKFTDLGIGAVDHRTLNHALAELDLPDFTGTARRGGRDGSEPYFAVKAGKLTRAQVAAVDQVLAAHAPPVVEAPEPPLSPEEIKLWRAERRR